MRRICTFILSTLLFAPMAFAGDTNVQWLGHADGCEFQYANIDGVVVENLVNCPTEWLYPNKAASTSNVSVVRSRVYDLRSRTVCTTGAYSLGGIDACRTIEELRSMDNRFSSELVRRFDWLVEWMNRTESNPRPQLDEFTACVAEQAN